MTELAYMSWVNEPIYMTCLWSTFMLQVHPPPRQTSHSGSHSSCSTSHPGGVTSNFAADSLNKQESLLTSEKHVMCCILVAQTKTPHSWCAGGWTSKLFLLDSTIINILPTWNSYFLTVLSPGLWTCGKYMMHTQLSAVLQFAPLSCTKFISNYSENSRWPSDFQFPANTSHTYDNTHLSQDDSS